MSEGNGTGGVRRLPLWKNCLEDMLAEGVYYGKVYNAEWFELQLSCKRDTRQFGLAVHKIRVQLEERGFFLQGHAQREGKLVILPKEKNLGVCRAKDRRIRKDQRRQVNLLTGTPLEGMKPRLKVAFEKATKRALIRQMLMNRSAKFTRIIQKAEPKALEP